MQFTCTLWSLTSAARHSAKRTTAAFDAAYAPKFGRVWPDPPPTTRMILPERFSTMGGSAARQELTAPIRLISMVSFHALGLVESSGPMGPCTPAEAISTSSPPKTTFMRSTAACNCSRSRTSARRRRALPPACSISSLAMSSSAWLRPSRPTRAPASANPSARRFPMPRPAPVIRTLLFRMLFKRSILHSGVERPGPGKDGAAALG